MNHFIYNPADEPTAFLYNAVEHVLAPNAVTRFSDQTVVTRCLQELGATGVMIVDGPTANKGEIEEAEGRHADYLRRLLAPMVAAAKQRQASGFTLTADEQAAIAKLKEWEVLVK